ncbi:MAG: DUF1573 domain-containing protein [Bacteroidales bacterium]|nr:DUF1573 domain-containing protein [Bacteroidales bacterium]
MKKLVLSLAMIVAVFCVMAQPKIEFEKKTHEFGDVHEEGGKITAHFIVKNIGNQDLLLTNVKPGCGCTAANYTRDAIAPGATGYIDATYDPWGRPGNFNKNIKVSTNEPDQTSPYIIFIKGNVIKRPPTKYELAGYKAGKGEVRVKETQVRVNVTNTSFQIDTLWIKSFYEDGRKISVQTELPAYIQEMGRSFGNELKAGEEGYIVLKYDGAARNVWGSTKDKAILITNDSIESKKYIYYNVNIKEDFSRMTPKEMEKAPKAEYDKVVFRFDTIGQNRTATDIITLKNTGKTPLIIRKIETNNNNALSYKVSSMTVEPNQSATIELTFKSQSRRGKQTLSLDIITNSPTNPIQTIKVEGFIQH